MFYFLPADIVSQTLNFGLPAPFDVQIVGRDQADNRAIAVRLADEIRKIPGAVDVRVQQPDDCRNSAFPLTATKAAELGLDRAKRGQLGVAGLERQQPGARRPTGSIPSVGIAISDQRPRAGIRDGFRAAA